MLPYTAIQGDIPENLCGRVYIPGLKETDNPDIAILFDKKATPGDHCHGLSRLRAQHGREIMSGMGISFIPQEEWQDFVSQQIEKLVAAGMPRDQAEWYYDQVDK